MDSTLTSSSGFEGVEVDESRKVSLRRSGARAEDTSVAKPRRKPRQSATPEATAPRVPVAKTYKLYIGGKFPRSESGRYYTLEHKDGRVIANVCRASRKDFRDAVVAARSAFDGWSGASAYLRGQILYRIAEMLEGRADQFTAELVLQGLSKPQARTEVTASIDRLVYYAGWADKYQQVFSAVNPVSSSHFNFSMLEPMGVISILAPASSGLLGLISNIAPVIAGGNSCVVLASHGQPLSAISFAEVLHASDVPPGVVNILTGLREELREQFASHMDVNAVIYCDEDAGGAKQIQEQAARNIKRVISRVNVEWHDASAQGPYLIKDTQETKTTWHPVGR